MIVLLDEEALAAGVSPALGAAIEDAIAAARLGHHRLLVSPRTMQALEGVEPVPSYLQSLRINQSGWVEGQAFANNSSRVIVLTDNVGRRNLIDKNKFYVHVEDIERHGILKSSSVVMENMLTDIKLLKLYMMFAYDLSEAEFRRYWHAVPEQGGGSTLWTFVDRYADQANPMSLIADRDGPGDPSSGSTAARCITALVQKGIFSLRSDAIDGGFSVTSPNISFHVLGARSIENLVFPQIMDLFFSLIPAGEEWRKNAIVEKFPNFPNLNEHESEEWLWVNFKKFGQTSPVNIFDSRCINRLLDAIGDNVECCARFAQAFELTRRNAAFNKVIFEALRDSWAVGQRWRALL